VRPKPAHIDPHQRVPLPACPRSQGLLSDRRALTQYIEELPPVRPEVTELRRLVRTLPANRPLDPSPSSL
jgi:hypothetical protein